MLHIKRILPASIFLLNVSYALSQTVVFDLYKYTEPLNWKKETREGMIIYSEVNPAEGTFGQIGLYTSRKSSNDPESEFIKDWNELISAKYSITSIPEVIVTSLDAYWKVAQRTMQASRNGQNFMLRISDYTGQNSTSTIITTWLGDKYKNEIDKFISSIEMAGPVSKNNDTSIPTISSDLRNPGSSLSFLLPEGWGRQVKDNYISLFPSKLFQGERIEIRILEPLNTPELQSAAADSWQEISQTLNENLYNDLFPGQMRTTSSGSQFYYERKNTRRFNGLDTEIDLYLTASGNRTERCVVISDEFRIQGVDYFSRTRFFDDISNIVHTVMFAEKSDSKASLEGGSITGVWTGISGGFSGYSGTYDQKTFFAVFFNNGMVYFRDRLPDNGLYQLDPAVWKNVYPDYWATYTFSGDRGIIKSKYYGDMPLVMAGNKLTITKNGLDHSYLKLNSPDGMTLSGTWAFETGESITFGQDGSFKDNGALAILEHSLYYKPYTVTYNPRGGKYEIRDFTAIFTYPDGAEFRCAFPAFDADKNNHTPSILIFGIDDFLKLK